MQRAMPHQLHPAPEAAQNDTPPDEDRPPRRSVWARLGQVLSIAFFVAVVWLVQRYARNLDWGDIWSSVTDTPAPMLAAAVVLAVASHLLYSCFDLIGRRYTGHHLRAPAVMAVSFVSYAFNLCIGSIVGGVGFRYRLYSRLGLSKGVITRIVSMSMLTNWLGYKLLAGLLFLFRPLQLPPSWHMGNHGLQWLGGLLVLISAGYLVACMRSGDKTWTVRGHELYLPPWRMAALQMAISALNWTLMAGIIWMLLGRALPYDDVLTVLLIGAIAGVVAHVPAGLGVFEFVFVALLWHRVPESHLIAALLGYRAVYYIAPLAVAAGLYLYMELHARRQRKREGQAPAGEAA